MNQCVIFCAGEFSGLTKPLGGDELVIAADGGLRHTQYLGLRPDIILGDFDSLGQIPDGAQVHPVEKDDTDSMLAIKKGLELGCREFLLYGSLDGPRLDHTVANFQSLQYLAAHGAIGYLVGTKQIVTLVQNATLRFPAHWTGYFSVFCLGNDAEGVSIRGAKYEIANGRLTSAFPLGVSNQFIGREAAVEVTDGSLLLIWDKGNGLP